MYNQNTIYHILAILMGSMIKTISIKFVSLSAVAILLVATILPFLAEAQSVPAVDLNGYAWSENIGWISFNCLTGSPTGGNACSTSNYKVTINADRTVTGYAWSENIGWIKFGGLSGFPTGSGTTNANVTVSGTYPNLTFTGWARACAGTDAPTTSESKNCSSMTNNDNSGGWDGWISLGGTGYSVKSNSSGMVNGSWAWGSTVVGWIDMDTYLTLLMPSATLSGTGCTIAAGSGTCNGRFTWAFSNTTAENLYNAAAPAVTYNSNQMTGTNVAYPIQEGNNAVQARDGSLVLNTITVVGTCAAGSTYSPTADICALPPTLSISFDPKIVRSGQTADIIYTVTGLVDGSCSVTGPGTNQTGITTDGTNTITSTPLTSYSEFTLSCTGSYGTVNVKSPIEVVPVSQEI